MKELRLHLKAKWYDMIESGEKKEEYRKDRPCWNKRLWNDDGTHKHYDIVTFVYGYTRRTMSYEYKWVEYNTGKPKWGADPNIYYNVIKYGKRIK